MATIFMVLAIDLAWETTESPIYTVFKTPAPLGEKPLSYFVHATLEELSYSTSSKAGTGKLAVKVTAQDPKDEIASVSFSVGESADKSRFFMRKDSTEFSGEYDVQLSPNSPRLARVEVSYDIELPVSEDRHALFYPFDRFSFSLAPQACVNDEFGSCFSSDQKDLESLQIPALEIDLSSFYQTQDLCAARISNDSLRFSLCRDSFIRMISVYFFVVVAIFLWHILRTQEPKEVLAEALGLFAALWGLRQMLVPKDFGQFPTLVDYSVFLIYSLLFAIVTVKLWLR